jgi:ABC-type ATPase with predicted acetyltransferase domain
MLEHEWYKKRKCKIVYHSNKVVVRMTSGCSNPIWIFEGIARQLHLTNTPFSINVAYRAKECERKINDNSMLVNPITDL